MNPCNQPTETSSGTGLPKAIASGNLRSCGLPVECYVLDNGQRVLSGRQALRALTDGPKNAEKSSGPKNGLFARLASGIVEKLPRFKDHPLLIEFQSFHGLAKGITAEDFVEVLTHFSKGLVEGTLHPKQMHIGRYATSYLQAFAVTGLVAVIDERAQYQGARGPADLERLLGRVLRTVMSKWQSTFPKSLALALAKLHRSPWHGEGPYPRFLAEDFGFIYEMALGPSAVRELRRRNPTPKYNQNHHQLLQDGVRRILHDDLVVAELLAHQSAMPAEWRRRMRAHFCGDALQLSLGAVRRERRERASASRLHP